MSEHKTFAEELRAIMKDAQVKKENQAGMDVKALITDIRSMCMRAAQRAERCLLVDEKNLWLTLDCEKKIIENWLLLKQSVKNELNLEIEYTRSRALKTDMDARPAFQLTVKW